MVYLQQHTSLLRYPQGEEARERSSRLQNPPMPAPIASKLEGRSVSSSSSSDDHTSISSTTATTISSTQLPGTSPATHTAFTPPKSTSFYRWQHLPIPAIWWRNVDSMANFILHWQHRFHQHGDMFASCTLTVSPSTSSPSPCVLTKSQLREAVRRLRFDHPIVALRLAKRVDLNIPPLEGLPQWLEETLQVALVYDCIESESAIEKWLDEAVIFHEEPRIEGEWRSFVRDATTEGVPGRTRFRVHYWPPSAGKEARVLVEQCHSVSEGIGMLMVFDLLLSYIASVLVSPTPEKFNWGEEETRLEPSLQDAVANPPPSWDLAASERKQLAKVNAERMNGKAASPNLVDKVGVKVVALTLECQSGKSKVRQALTRPLLQLCRSVAAKGKMLPLGMLPHGSPSSASRTHTDLISTTLDPSGTATLLKVLKGRGLTLAPFMEACSYMTTMWVRKHRQLVPKGGKKSSRGYDNPSRILGSFSNAISKRDTLLPEHHRYKGLCMSGFATKLPASSAILSPTADTHTIPSPTDPQDQLPNITSIEIDRLWTVTTDLAKQYQEGRSNPKWLQHDQALLMDTMTTEKLFLREEWYPSMVWLSSIGRTESVFRSSHPLAGLSTESGSSPTSQRVSTSVPDIESPPTSEETPATSTVDSTTSEEYHHPTEEKKPPTPKAEVLGPTLDVNNLRLVGRVGIRQPILHVYTFRMHTTIQFSFADWLYNPAHREAGEKDRQNILAFWLQVFRSLIDSVLLEVGQA